MCRFGIRYCYCCWFLPVSKIFSVNKCFSHLWEFKVTAMWVLKNIILLALDSYPLFEGVNIGEKYSSYFGLAPLSFPVSHPAPDVSNCSPVPCPSVLWESALSLSTENVHLLSLEIPFSRFSHGCQLCNQMLSWRPSQRALLTLRRNVTCSMFSLPHSCPLYFL